MAGDVSRRTLLRAFATALGAAPLGRYVAPAPAVVASAWRFEVARGPYMTMGAGWKMLYGYWPLFVAVGPDGKLRAARVDEYQWMKRVTQWDPSPTGRLLYEIMKGKASA
jgi:hypothetical protein